MQGVKKLFLGKRQPSNQSPVIVAVKKVQSEKDLINYICQKNITVTKPLEDGQAAAMGYFVKEILRNNKQLSSDDPQQVVNYILGKTPDDIKQFQMAAIDHHVKLSLKNLSKRPEVSKELIDVDNDMQILLGLLNEVTLGTSSDQENILGISEDKNAVMSLDPENIEILHHKSKDTPIKDIADSETKEAEIKEFVSSMIKKYKQENENGDYNGFINHCIAQTREVKNFNFYDSKNAKKRSFFLSLSEEQFNKLHKKEASAPITDLPSKSGISVSHITHDSEFIKDDPVPRALDTIKVHLSKHAGSVLKACKILNKTAFNYSEKHDGNPLSYKFLKVHCKHFEYKFLKNENFPKKDREQNQDMILIIKALKQLSSEEKKLTGHDLAQTMQKKIINHYIEKYNRTGPFNPMEKL